jgi:hypothetical protein
MTSTNPEDIRPSGTLRPAYRLAVLGLLVLITAQIFLSTRQESQTFDESDHLYAGYEYWKHADFGRNPDPSELLEGSAREQWQRKSSCEIGQLFF